MDQEPDSPAASHATHPEAELERGFAIPRRSPGGAPHCQVAGCSRPLHNDPIRYYKKFKICRYHSNVDSIVLDGQVVRFCQQCGRFQPLEDFDCARKSCYEALAKHNARRRKNRQRKQGGGRSSGSKPKSKSPAKAEADSAAERAICPETPAAPPLKLEMTLRTRPSCDSLLGSPRMPPAPQHSGSQQHGSGMECGAAELCTPLPPHTVMTPAQHTFQQMLMEQGHDLGQELEQCGRDAGHVEEMQGLGPEACYPGHGMVPVELGSPGGWAGPCSGDSTWAAAAAATAQGRERALSPADASWVAAGAHAGYAAGRAGSLHSLGADSPVTPVMGVAGPSGHHYCEVGRMASLDSSIEMDSFAQKPSGVVSMDGLEQVSMTLFGCPSEDLAPHVLAGVLLLMKSNPAFVAEVSAGRLLTFGAGGN